MYSWCQVFQNKIMFYHVRHMYLLKDKQKIFKQINFISQLFLFDPKCRTRQWWKETIVAKCPLCIFPGNNLGICSQDLYFLQCVKLISKEEVGTQAPLVGYFPGALTLCWQYKSEFKLIFLNMFYCSAIYWNVEWVLLLLNSAYIKLHLAVNLLLHF